MKKITMGILAHVDAGKTTLSEAILYLTGKIRKLGRVDHQDAFLDHVSMERKRGITIFSKQALFDVEDSRFTLVDTPGHVDFSAEMERTLQILDYAVLVISGSDGVQGHTETLWRLLDVYRIPVFVFVNKMDQAGADREALMEDVRTSLSDACMPFDMTRDEEWYENISMTDENAMEEYLESGFISEETIRRLIGERKVFPCYFGSALKLEGVEELLAGLHQNTAAPVYPEDFSARVYKISRDEQGTRLTHLKITGGKLPVKTLLDSGEKADQIRIYSGGRYDMVQSVEAGDICSVTGLTKTAAGQGLGMERDAPSPVLAPIFRYQLLLPEGYDRAKALQYLRQLGEEEPELHVGWDSHSGEIFVQLMGEVQTEILKTMLKDRFDMDVSFGAGRILYRESIRESVIGVGHYEPLRHYAEVHLKLEPLPPGSGLVFGSECSEDVLARNWQRLILTHLAEKEHIGVLTGSPVTDMRISLIAGRAHPKHTEGGDFRQATYRAVRQGLKKAETVLLEPWLAFELEVPGSMIGRAMNDIQNLSGHFEAPALQEDQAILCGEAPASGLVSYQTEVWSYTKGRGRMKLSSAGYQPCHNTAQILEENTYDSERDIDNPTGSVFCTRGAGYTVPWDQVEQKMHIKDTNMSRKREESRNPSESGGNSSSGAARRSGAAAMSSYGDDPELLAIMEREFGSRNREKDQYSGYRKQTVVKTPEKRPLYSPKRSENKKEYLLVDGYNVIFAWEDLRKLSEVSIEAARNKLMDIMSNYQGFVGCTLILVFDAYKVKGNPGDISRYHNIYVVYTKEAETADTYIERTTHEIAKQNRVTVATSDGMEQIIVLGNGASRISSRDFEEEVARVEQQIRETAHRKQNLNKNYLFDHMDRELQEQMEDIRLGKEERSGK